MITRATCPGSGSRLKYHSGPSMGEEMDTLTAILYDHLTTAFGHEPTMENQLGKLEEEIQEFLVDLEIEELADIVVVCCMMARCCGYTVQELLDHVLVKMRTNATRTWGAGDGTVARHI